MTSKTQLEPLGSYLPQYLASTPVAAGDMLAPTPTPYLMAHATFLPNV